jgi:hypothetical protein
MIADMCRVDWHIPSAAAVVPRGMHCLNLINGDFILAQVMEQNLFRSVSTKNNVQKNLKKFMRFQQCSVCIFYLFGSFQFYSLWIKVTAEPFVSFRCTREVD